MRQEKSHRGDPDREKETAREEKYRRLRGMWVDGGGYWVQYKEARNKYKEAIDVVDTCKVRIRIPFRFILHTLIPSPIPIPDSSDHKPL